MAKRKAKAPVEDRAPLEVSVKENITVEENVSLETSFSLVAVAKTAQPSAIAPEELAIQPYFRGSMYAELQKFKN